MMISLGVLVPVVFTALFMRALHGWLTSKTGELVPGRPAKPKA